MSAVSSTSFTPIGTPCSGPRGASRSRARASASASPGSMNAHARTVFSRDSMRSRHARTSASDVISRRAIPRAASQAESSLGVVILRSAATKNLLFGKKQILRFAQDDRRSFGVQMRRIDELLPLVELGVDEGAELVGH